MMMNFCKSFLGFSDSRHFPLPSPNGLSLVAAGELNNPTIVLTSLAVKPAGKPPEGKDPDLHRWIGSYDVDGLRSCTESLGFESSDEIGSENGEKEIMEIRSRYRSRKKAREGKSRGEKLKFPPPLPSLNLKGERRFFLKPEKKDGRLLLTEVMKIERQEILLASRQDGRLRLELIKRPDDEVEVKEEEEKEKEDGEDLTVHQKPMIPLGRCQELRPHDHPHHHLSYWSQWCVTTT